MTTPRAAPLSLHAWRALSWCALPFLAVFLWVRQQSRRGRARYWSQRFGYSQQPRPQGKLIWLRAVSVGDAISSLKMVEQLTSIGGDAPHGAGGDAPHVLLTTGTTTSANLMRARTHPRLAYQFSPMDTPAALKRFMNHWQPDLVIIMESELWPNLFYELHRRKIPRLVLNGRLSLRSTRRWRRFAPSLAAWLLQSLDEIAVQDETYAQRFRSLGASQELRRFGNLKLDAPPLPADETQLAQLRQWVGKRPVWLASNTHKGEHDPVAAAHYIIRSHHPKLLTVIALRHPALAGALRKNLESAGLPVAQRSLGEPITAATEVYLADTMGELGLFYRLCEVAFIGGSLIKHGGQNPMEAARLDSAILHGPYVDNFAEIYANLHKQDGALCVKHSGEMSEAVSYLLSTYGPGLRARRAMAAVAKKLADDNGIITKRTVEFIRKMLEARG